MCVHANCGLNVSQEVAITTSSSSSTSTFYHISIFISNKYSQLNLIFTYLMLDLYICLYFSNIIAFGKFCPIEAVMVTWNMMLLYGQDCFLSAIVRGKTSPVVYCVVG